MQIAAQSGVHKDVEAGRRIFGSPAIDLKDYGRQAVNIKNLPRLIDRVKALEEALKEQK